MEKKFLQDFLVNSCFQKKRFFSERFYWHEFFASVFSCKSLFLEIVGLFLRWFCGRFLLIISLMIS